MTVHPLDANEVGGALAPSYYEAHRREPRPILEPLEGETRADVCIVGGGYTGLSAALHLAEAGADVVLLEAHRLGWGASGRNGGQLCSGLRLEVEALERMFGPVRAQRLWAFGEEAKRLARGLIARHDVDCSLRDGILYPNHRARFDAASRAGVAKLRDRYGYAAIDYLTPDAMRARLRAQGYSGGALDRGAGHLQPLDLALGLARAATAARARLFERSRVTRITPAEGAGRPALVETAAGRVRADWVLLGANGYLGDLVGEVARRVMPINNFVLATEPLSEARAAALIPGGEAVSDSRFVVNYYRLSPERRLLFGGGESYGARFPRDLAGLVRRRMLRVFPDLADLRIDYAWGGTLGITMSRLPHFARLGPRLLSAGGYSGQGVALALIGGRAMAEVVKGETAGFDLLAKVPPPRFPGGAAMRWPLLALGMLWYSLRDRL